jgi:zinc protease
MTLRRRTFLSGTLAMTAAALAPIRPVSSAGASRVERVVSPGGIEAWLVRQTQLPIIALAFAMPGGSAQDPADRPGLANMMAALMDEGAGERDSEDFSRALEERAIQLSFSATRDHVSGSMRLLSEHRSVAFALLKDALARPRFDPAPTERIRQSLLANLRRRSTTPGSMAGDAFWQIGFPGHPYGRQTIGTLEGVSAVTRDDLVAMHRRQIARAGLKVAVVGDIEPAELAVALDEVFSGLPASGALDPVAPASLAGLGQRRIIPVDVPQATISFGLPGLLREDEDFVPAFVVNHVLGGGSFSSRLYQEVRERRGLAYSVSSSLMALDRAGLVTGGTSTRNDRAAESLAVIEAELKRMGESGPGAEELDQAKRYLIGSWALRFETSTQIAGNLIRIQLDGYGPDYLDRRNGLIAAVTLADARRVAARLFGDPKLLVVVAGKPEGL